MLHVTAVAILLLTLAAPVQKPTASKFKAPVDLSGHWMLDDATTSARRTRLRQDPASDGRAGPLGKELVITQTMDRVVIDFTLGERAFRKEYRFDGVETRNLAIGRDSPIQERSTAHWARHEG
jgi:hypothetical protein